MADEVMVVESDNILEVLGRLALATGKLAAGVTAWLDWACPYMEQQIVSSMHFKNPTGELASSIRTEVMSLFERWVGTDLLYGVFVEYGTGQRGSGSGPTPPDGYTYGPRPGMDAEPYITIAFNTNEAALFSVLVQMLQKAIDGV